MLNMQLIHLFGMFAGELAELLVLPAAAYQGIHMHTAADAWTR